LNEDELTVEHIIPKSIGGILRCRFLCPTCNSKFGAGFEANASLAPELRKAASGLMNIPTLKEKLERGAEYQGQFGDRILKNKLRRDGNIGTAKLGEKSWIVPEQDTPNHLTSTLRKAGLTDQEISDALSKWEAAPADEIDELDAGYSFLKWLDHPIMPTYTEPPMSLLVPLKIAYEFAALLVGNDIYRPEFQHLRQILIDQDEDMAGEIVTYQWAKIPDTFRGIPFHGIVFEGNQEVAQFQVRLFDTRAFIVRLSNIAIEHPPIVYTHRLDTGEDRIHMPS
ncbi:hypothetical protein MNBD_ALPHA07-1893, partial [hydrothermal vent metagenome]